MKSLLAPIAAVTLISCASGAGDSMDEERGGGAGGKADSLQWGSCAESDQLFCGGRSAGTCYCDELCADFHDCCADASPACGVDSNRLEDRTAGKTPLLTADDLEVVADLPFPPGNVAVSPEGRVFISFFPDGNKGDFKIAEIVDGAAVRFPSDQALQDRLVAVLGVRADRQGRLWLLDHGNLGLSRPKLIAIDIASQAVVFEHAFSSSEAGLGSLLNDVVISPDGRLLYISDLSPLRRSPAIVVIDLGGALPVVRRRLERHPSVENGPYDVFVGGVEMKVKGLRTAQGIDGIALDASGAFLYYAALNGGALFRVPTAALVSGASADGAVEKVADITMTDGMIADAAGNVYLTDMEHSAIVRAGSAGRLDLVLADPRLRWPDGFGWAPDGSLYVTASALHTFLPRLIVTEAAIAAGAPYQLFRLPAP